MFDPIRPLMQQYSDLMTGETIGTQIGCYSIAFTGLVIAARKIRPFSRFQKPTDVPKHFIQKRIELTGTVESINPNGGLLMVQHKPLVPLSRKKVENLPVRLSGIQVTGHGVNWLQAIVAGNKITFIPVKQDKNAVHCEVTMEQLTYDKKLRTLNIAESLVSIGFGKILSDEISKTDVERIAYRNQLLHAEKIAQKRELGVKYYLIPMKIMLMNFLIKMYIKTKNQVQRLVISAQKPAAKVHASNKVAVN